MSSSLPTLAVTGATGGVGGRVAADLARRGIPQRLVVRDAARAPELPRASVVTAAYGDRAAARAALEGVEVLLFVSAAEKADRLAEHRAFVAAATDAGVRHVVYTSFVGASAESTFTLGRDHGATEDAIRASGMAFTILRDNLYSDFLVHLVGDDGVLRGPAGDGRGAFVARADVADVAALVLREPSRHEGAGYDLTGPAALSLTQVASALAATLGREIRYHDETLEEAYASRARYGAPGWQLDAWVSTYTAIRAGELAAVSSDVQRLLRRPARSLGDVLSGGR
ncbi:NAD(P)H-binding protein [Galbitalea sp. SE-J8]|uniref:NAD(P)H-binding protein n=1 Tax=Galbitalea sp. SE-J8 TaxID=3054952 RepID=UPI00259CEE58|nr:NAD(P)H-binding protein [Galbitalea sp. SE-J8]MDM4761765.1 NAD(P)H-binding protein [Galbitalea sp. SE-J8]